jgi:hypothetical protein
MRDDATRRQVPRLVYKDLAGRSLRSPHRVRSGTAPLRQLRHVEIQQIDGRVVGRGQVQTHFGPKIDRVEADLILRDAMAGQGTPWLRRSLMWIGVTFWLQFWQSGEIAGGRVGVPASCGCRRDRCLRHLLGVAEQGGDGPVGVPDGGMCDGARDRQHGGSRQRCVERHLEGRCRTVTNGGANKNPPALAGSLPANPVPDATAARRQAVTSSYGRS